ncbi:unnamed protein product, partial [marine sediment metagenome]
MPRHLVSYDKLGKLYVHSVLEKNRDYTNHYFSNQEFEDVSFGVELELIGSLNRFDSTARVNNCILAQSDPVFHGEEPHRFKKNTDGTLDLSLSQWSQYLIDSTSNHGGTSHKGRPIPDDEGSAGWRLEYDSSVGLPYTSKHLIIDNKDNPSWNGNLLPRESEDITRDTDLSHLENNVVLPINGTHEEFSKLKTDDDVRVLLN